MATPDVDITPSESQLETDILENKESKKSNEGSLPNEKIKTSLNVLKTSCLCTSVAGVCTCIHLNGNFNNAKIKKVLTLIQEPTMCEAGPSTSSYSRIKRRKLPSSESSDERLSIIESKKVCKALDSDDLDSDDVSANEADVIDDPSQPPDSQLLIVESKSLITPSSPAPSSSSQNLEPMSPSSPSTSSMSTISTPSLSSSSSPVREEREGSTNPSANRRGLLSFIRIINSAFSEREDSDTQHSNDDINREENEDSDDDDDDRWMDSDTELLEDVESAPNPAVLDKPMPKHNWFPVHEIVQRQYGSRTRYQNPSLFQQRYYGSLHAVQRFELMYKMDKHKGCVNALDFHPTGNLLASASDDRKVVIWDWARGKALYSYSSGHSSNVFQSKWLHLAGSTGFVVGGASGRTTQLIAQHKRSAHKLSVMRDSPHVLLSVGEDGRVLSVDIRESASTNSKEFLMMRKGKGNCCMPLYSVASNPLNSNEFIVAGEDTKVHLFDKRFVFTKNAKPLKKFCPHTIKKDSKEIHYYITCAVYNYSGTEILASYNDERIYLFDSTTSCVPDSTISDYKHCYEGHRNSATVKGVNFFGPHSEYVVSGSDDAYIYIWDKNTEAIVNWMRGDDDGVVNCIEPHPDIPVIATSGLDNNVKIWVPSCEHPPKFDGLKKTIMLNEKKRSLIDPGSIPIYSHFQWLWQSAFDSVRVDEEDETVGAREDEDSGDDDPRQCATS
ncbi:hypothetical protein M8J75_016161 [Diaphorina citri]|nr:hypothetical protein M8J75_016161 [Diaphorina citri]